MSSCSYFLLYNNDHQTPSEHLRPAPDPEHNDECHSKRGTRGHLQMHGEISHCQDDDQDGDDDDECHHKGGARGDHGEISHSDL